MRIKITLSLILILIYKSSFSQETLSKVEFNEFTYGDLSTCGYSFSDVQKRTIDLKLNDLIDYDSLKAQKTTSMILRLNDSIQLNEIHIKKFTNLKHLYIWDGKKIPEWIFKINTLEFLKINNAKFKMELPDKFDGLTKLIGIQFESYSIKTFPESILKLSNLKSIYFDHSSIEDGLPDDLFKLKKLEHLSLDYSQTSNLKALSKVKSLKYLKYKPSQRDNKSNLEISEIFQLKNLAHLALIYNDSTELKDISKLKNLKSLYLYGNNISQEIFNMTQLEYLSFKDNGITRLPSQFSNFTKLYGLEIWKCNNLKHNLSTINQLTSLRYLNLIKLESLTELPELNALVNLKNIIIKGNPLLTVPTKINGIRVQTY